MAAVGNIVVKVRYRTASGPKTKSIPIEGLNSSHVIESVELVKSTYVEEVIDTLEFNRPEKKKPDLKLVGEEPYVDEV